MTAPTGPSQFNAWPLRGAALLAMLAAVAAVAWRVEPPPREQRAVSSSYSSGPMGTRAFYLALESTGMPVERMHGRADELSTAPTRLLVMTSPSVAPIRREEADALIEWVSAGNILLYFANGEDPLDDTSGHGAHPADRALLERLGVGVRPPAGVALDPRLLATVPITPPTGPSLWTFGSRGIFAGAAGGLTLTRSDQTPLYSENGLVQAANIPRGTGRVLLFGSTAPIANRSIAEADNLRALFTLVHSINNVRGVLFEENHHGQTARRTWAEVVGHPSFWLAALQSTVLACLFLWGSERREVARRGRAEDRRGTLEYIQAMSGLYRRAGPSGEVLRPILQGIRDDLARRFGIPPHGVDANLVQRVAALVDQPRERIERVLQDAEQAVTAPSLPPSELLRLARELHDCFERNRS